MLQNSDLVLTSLEDVVPASEPDADRVQYVCNYAFGNQLHVGRNLNFPGTMAVPLTRNTLNLLQGFAFTHQTYSRDTLAACFKEHKIHVPLRHPKGGCVRDMHHGQASSKKGTKNRKLTKQPPSRVSKLELDLNEIDFEF